MADKTGVYEAYKKDGTKYYRSSINYRNKHISLGSFSTENKAAKAYKEASLIIREGKYTILRLPSTEVRYVLSECIATIGTVGNEDFSNVSIGKAGRARHMGIRPQTRGSAMNPIDHPHGGGEGKSNGHRHPVSPWGQKCKGLKTRKPNKQSNKYIISKRKKGVR